MPEVSVILTSYNKPQWIGEAIESVLNQTFVDFELLIMEDNSSDPKVLEKINEYITDSRIKLYNSDVLEEDRKKLCRYAYLINLAVKTISTGDFITYLADDDLYYKDRLERMVSFLKETNHKVVYGNQDVADIELNVRGVRGPFGIVESGWNLIDHNSVMHSRDVFFEAGGWDEDPGTWGGSDSYFWDRIKNAGYQFYPLDGAPTDLKRYHEQSVQWLITNNLF